MPTVSQSSLPDMAEEVLGNFSAILESMDFAQELELLGIRKLHFRQRKRAIRELCAMGIGLWRLGLKRSFPSDDEFLFERFMLGLYEQAHTNKEREQANAFDLLVRSYIDKFGERGDTDFTTVSGHIVSLFRRKPGDTAAQRLKLALLMRNTYTDIFRHLI